MREITVSVGPNGNNYIVFVPDKASGLDIRKEIREQGVTIDSIWKLIGCNANGTGTLVKDCDIPWHEYFDLAPHWGSYK